MPRIRVDASVVAAAAARLGSDDARYTPRQLYYATCAAVEAPSGRLSSGEMGAGVVLILIGLSVIRLSHVATGILIVVGMLCLVMGLRMRAVERVRALSRALAISYDDFDKRLLAGMEVAALPGLIQSRTELGVMAPAAADAAVVVCDSSENALLVAAVLADCGLTATVVDQASLPEPPPGRAIVIHDCSPRGCALGSSLRDDGIATVEDIGVRPRDLLVGSYQVIQGAPARLPRDLAPVLAAEEVSWLLSGRRLELAAYPRDQLSARLRLSVGGTAASAAASL